MDEMMKKLERMEKSTVPDSELILKENRKYIGASMLEGSLFEILNFNEFVLPSLQREIN